MSGSRNYRKTGGQEGWPVLASLLLALVAGQGGCSSLEFGSPSATPTPPPTTMPAAAHRRQVLARANTVVAASLIPATQPTSQPATRPASQPADDGTQPCTLSSSTIARLVFELSPEVRAAREEMEAAQHGLAEFRANLSRFEPFTEVKAQANRFPDRQDATGRSGEVVAGLEKETFEGARFSVEGGGSASRVRYGDPDEDQDKVDEGSGGLIRGRIEVPFVGSRRRQERIINQAFQESSARQAQLNYIDEFRNEAVEALQFYESAIWYLSEARAYGGKIRSLTTLRQNPRVRPEDRARLDTSMADAQVLHDQYMNYHRDAMLSLLATIGLEPGTPYRLEEPQAYVPSKYIDMSATSQGQMRMVEEAYVNNPRFRVLDNAIRDAELQKQQAIQGTYDITAFVEGTQFPFGAESFDDRLGGWFVEAGVTVRLNDQRVLNATRLKAEARIRQFNAQIDFERLNIQRRISTHTDTLRSNHKVRMQILDAIKQKQATFEYRSRAYLSGESPPLTIDDVLIPLNEMTYAEIQLASNRYYSGLAETALTSAMGEVYQVVGMHLEESGSSSGKK